MSDCKKTKKKIRSEQGKWIAKDRAIKRLELEDEVADLKNQNHSYEEELARQGKEMIPRIEKLERENKKLESQLKQLQATEESLQQTLSKKEVDIEDLRRGLQVLKPTYDEHIAMLRKETEQRLGVLAECIGDMRDLLINDHGLEAETKLRMERKLKALLFLMGAKEEDILRSCNKTHMGNIKIPSNLDKATLEKQLRTAWETINQLKRGNTKLGKEVMSTKQKLTRESLLVAEQKMMIEFLKNENKGITNGT